MSHWTDDQTALAVEVGPRVLFCLLEEEAVSEATRHYESCDGYGGGADGGCEFCYFGPLDDIVEWLTHGLAQVAHRVQFLGPAWHF